MASLQQQQWEDAYDIAERMYNENRPFKQSELNVLERIICSRYNTIFKYDPYTDEYSFISQELKFESSVQPHCRPIAEADIENLKKNTMKVPFEVPSYVTVTPIYVVPPSTMLIFNYTQPVADGLEEALQRTSGLCSNPSETQVTPGAEFIFKHKNGKCYRCIVISEVSEETIGDGDRRYEVAFLDHCQIVPVKLKTLYMPMDVTLDKYPCALHCVRPLGINSFRPGYIAEYNNDIRTFYNDRTRRRAGVPALIYGIQEGGSKLVMDFPSLRGNKVSNSEEITVILGYHGIAKKDPFGLTYDQLMNKEIVQFEYPEFEEEIVEEVVEEPVVETNNRTDDDDDQVDLSDSDTEPPGKKLQINIKTVEDDECPFGRSSIDKFIQQAKGLPPSSKPSESSQSFLPPASVPKKSVPVPVQPQRIVQESIPLDARSNESMSSLQSTTINQTTSSNPTPQPTVDVQEIEEITPKKVLSRNDAGSSDGWGEDTPKKKDVRVAEPVRAWGDELGTTQKPLMFQKPSSAAPVIRSEEESQVRKPKSPSPPPPVQRPLTPTPQIVIPANDESKKSNPFPVPLMNIQTQTPEKYKLNDGFPSKRTEKRFGETLGNNTEPQSFPAVSTMTKNGTHSSLFGQPQAPTDNNDRNSSFIQWRENKVESSAHQSQQSSEHSFACNTTKHVAQQYKQTENDVFDDTHQEDSFQKIVHAPNQDANISKASTAQRLISNAQDNFLDSEGEDGWDVVDNNKTKTNDHTITDKIFANVIPVDKVAAMTMSNVADDDNFSRRSICSGNFGENEPDWERGADSETIVIVDEFAEVSGTLKQLAIAFTTAIRDAAIQRNRPIFSYEMMGMESISQKITNELDKRFWKIKVTEARNFDGAFD